MTAAPGGIALLLAVGVIVALPRLIRWATARRADEERHLHLHAVPDLNETDEPAAVTVHQLRITGPEDVARITTDPSIPYAVKYAAVAAAHRAGLCGCPPHPYDQDGALNDTDLAWLKSQQGERP